MRRKLTMRLAKSSRLVGRRLQMLSEVKLSKDVFTAVCFTVYHSWRCCVGCTTNSQLHIPRSSVSGADL